MSRLRRDKRVTQTGPGAGGASAATGDEPVTLENCDNEPIHIPGLIQQHGALLAVEPGIGLVAWSENVTDVLGVCPRAGASLTELGMDGAIQAAVDDCLALLDDGIIQPTLIEASDRWQGFDCIVHGNDRRVTIEFERRSVADAVVASFAMQAYAMIDRVKRERALEPLLERCVKQLRTISGFDRVMAYRFRHDDSGEVIAESKIDGVPSYLGLCYPASDIPAQARRLYTVSTIRTIPDVDYVARRVVHAPGAQALDMSYCVLRSVSPIHVEYLRNMGVQASMSISIVVGGRLWGLFACHHYAPRQLPFSVRMACDVLAQVIGALVTAFETREQSRLVDGVTTARSAVVEALLRSDDLAALLDEHGAALLEAFGAQAIIGLQGRQRFVHGKVDDAASQAIIGSLPVRPRDIVVREHRNQWPAAQAESLGQWVGLIGLNFDPTADGWLLLLRAEQIRTVRWGGEKPSQPSISGPLGPRLTPRGSFAEWRETVRDSSEPWPAVLLSAARNLLAEMQRAFLSRQAEFDLARHRLLEMLGHDLRNPLQSITMAADIMARGAPSSLQAHRRIQTSSSRMARLIDDVLDMSRISSGASLVQSKKPLDLRLLLDDLIEEAGIAEPGATWHSALPESLMIDADEDRLAQAIGNLISNAHHHGHANGPIEIELLDLPAMARIVVRNAAKPIPAARAALLFDPLRRPPSDAPNPRNRSGLGIGLYIASQIAKGHGGTLTYRHEADKAVFTLDLPAKASAAAGT